MRTIALGAVGMALALAAAFLMHDKLSPWLWHDGQWAAAVAIFIGTYFVLAVGKLPGYRLDRAGAALLGAALMVGFGVLPLEAAYRAIDFDTITLLLGMMILVANLKLSGFFRLVNGFIMRQARHPLVLLLAVVLVCGFFSAFLVNDTICLIMTPIVAELVLSLKRDPVPYLLAIPMASTRPPSPSTTFCTAALRPDALSFCRPLRPSAV